MDHHRDRQWLETLTFELNMDQVASLNKLMPSNKFRFRPYDDASKNASRARLNQTYNAPLEGGKISFHSKRPADAPRETSYYESSFPNGTSNAPSVVDQPSTPVHTNVELLNKIRDIVSNDFPNIKNEFDFAFLERGINDGYFITLEEFKIAAKQVIRAMSNKHPELNFSCKLPDLSPINWDSQILVLNK